MKPKPLLQGKDCGVMDLELQAVSSEPLTLVLLGHSGVGKSATGNTILQRDAFESRLAFRSVTMKISEQSGSVGGQEVRVVDTPGIMGAQEEVRAFCQELRRNRRPHVFLFVLKIDRFTAEQEAALRSAMGAVGEEPSRGVLLFTGADFLRNMTLHQFIHDDPENPLVSLVQEFGDRVHMFNNSLSPEQNIQEKHQEQVLELMRKIQQMKHEPSEEPSLEEVRLMLLGLPGVGKSCTGNTILGSGVFENSCSSNAVTVDTRSQSAEVNGRRVTVVDTPGFCKGKLGERELYDQMVGYVEKAGEPGLNAFVIVVRLGRISDADCLLFKLMSLLFDMSLSYFTVLFTHGDDLQGTTMEEFINSNAAVKELVSKCGRRYCVFNNKQNGDLRQVQELLRVIDKMNTVNQGQKYNKEVLEKKHKSVISKPEQLKAFTKANGIPPPREPNNGAAGSPPSDKKTFWSFFDWIRDILNWILKFLV